MSHSFAMDIRKKQIFKSHIHSLIRTNWDFQQKLKQRLVKESLKVENPFDLIAGLFSGGVLSDDPSDQHGNSGLIQIIAQLVMMLTCSQGADAIGGLVDVMEASGNLELASCIRSWIEEYSGPGAARHLKTGKAGTSVTHTGANLIDNMTTQMKIELMKHIGGQWVGMASTIATSSQLFSNVAHASARHYANQGLATASGQGRATSPPRKRACPISHQVVTSSFFEQAAPLYEPSKLQCQRKSKIRGISQVQFDKKRMMASSIDGSLYLWNWDQKPIHIAVHVKSITCFQYDEEILILGTAQGTVHLFDVRRLEEKRVVRLSEAVISLKFIESTLLVTTGKAGHDSSMSLILMDISRPDMKLPNQQPVNCSPRLKNKIAGVFMCRDISFVYGNKWINVYETKSGKPKKYGDNPPCYLEAIDVICTLNVCDLMSRKKVVVAGCQNGMIEIWSTSKLWSVQNPYKSFQGHDQKIMCLSSLNGHLLSLDHSGKLLMWSGFDLENKKKKTSPAKWTLEESSTLTHLASHERWFATASSKNGLISMWTVPDSWLSSG